MYIGRIRMRILKTKKMSLEVSLDTVIEVAKHIGFYSVHAEQGEEMGRKFCHYLSSPNSMRPQGYECALWVEKIQSGTNDC